MTAVAVEAVDPDTGNVIWTGIREVVAPNCDYSCECGGSGLHWDGIPAAGMERCDMCEAFEGDLDAAAWVAMANRGTVRYVGYRRDENGRPFIHPGTDPWVES